MQNFSINISRVSNLGQSFATWLKFDKLATIKSSIFNSSIEEEKRRKIFLKDWIINRKRDDARYNTFAEGSEISKGRR